MDEVLRIERDGRVAVLTLNRPDALNALSRALRRKLAETFRQLSAASDVSAIVLTGSGGRAFSVGVDLKEAAEVGMDDIADPEFDFASAMLACPWPIIAAVNGFAITGGLEAVVLCDLAYASTTAKFADTHGRVGIIPGWGLSQRLPRILGAARAKEMSFTGNFLDAQTAERWGLVNRVFEPEALLPAALKLAREMADLQPDMLRKYKRLIDDGLQGTLAQGMALEAKACRAHLAGVSPADIAAARGAVQSRGRSQQD